MDENSRESLIWKGEIDLRNAVISLTHAQSTIFLYSIERSISKVLENFQEFQKEIHNIDNASSTIKEISNKTKMLSLNASIEAARAGTAGRGFKVVAEEVGKLSNQTTQCTDEVNKINSSMLGNAEANQGALRELDDCVVKFSESQGATDMSKFTAVEESGYIITTLAKRLEDHARFMLNLLKKRDPRTPLNDHHTCAFGKWYDQNRNRYRHLSGYEAIYDVHKSFHQSASKFDETRDIEALVDLLGFSESILNAFLVLADSFRRGEHEVGGVLVA